MRPILFDILLLLILSHAHSSLIFPIFDATFADQNVKQCQIGTYYISSIFWQMTVWAYKNAKKKKKKK